MQDFFNDLIRSAPKERKVIQAVSWDMLTEDEDLEIQEFWYANGWQVSQPMKLNERIKKYWLPRRIVKENE